MEVSRGFLDPSCSHSYGLVFWTFPFFVEHLCTFSTFSFREMKTFFSVFFLVFSGTEQVALSFVANGEIATAT